MLKMLKKIALYAIAALLIYIIYVEFFIPVTVMNILLGILVMFLGAPLLMAAVMANDSGKGGWDVKLIQVLLLSFPLVYVFGLVSSIGVLYMAPFENQQEVALWLSSMAGIELVLAGSIFTIMLIHEDLNRRKKQVIKTKNNIKKQTIR